MFGIFNINLLPNPDDHNQFDLGCAPRDEQVPCAGFAHYEDKIQPVLTKWIRLLQKVFTDLPEYGLLSKVRRTTKYGPEWTVQLLVSKRKKFGKQFGIFVQENLPVTWQPEFNEILFVPEEPVTNDNIDTWVDETLGLGDDPLAGSGFLW